MFTRFHLPQVVRIFLNFFSLFLLFCSVTLIACRERDFEEKQQYNYVSHFFVAAAVAAVAAVVAVRNRTKAAF